MNPHFFRARLVPSILLKLALLKLALLKLALLKLTLLASILPVRSLSAAENVPVVDFDRDILPILSDQCFQCHGPDAAERQAELRLDTRDGVFLERDGRRIVSPSEPQASELLRRITTSDPDERMPPPDSQKKLTPQQVELIRQWIAQGARWQQHWAFITPQRPEVPTVTHPEFVAGPIDAFVVSRLEREQLTPSEPARRNTLLRRVTLDLTGLPPTPDELRAFLADDSPNAYERVVDRLLKSPRSAERLAIRWLDAARYADTSGYQSDGPREMWRWRDWVIESFHNNKPFDEFTIEQLAGDLLPNSTLDQRIATAFNRNHRGNAEGGIVPEEFQVEYVVDRVDTTFTVWQGLTMGCGRCHSHKYDPITQKEYYQVFAYFNNIPESGRALKEGNSPPSIVAPTRAQQVEWEKYIAASAAARDRFNEINQRVGVPGLSVWRAGEWKKSIDTPALDDWGVTRDLLVKLDLEQAAEPVLTKSPLLKNETAATAAIAGTNTAATTNSATTAAANTAEIAPLTMFEQSVELVPGQRGNAISLDGNGFVSAGNIAAFGYFDAFSIAVDVLLPELRAGTIVSKMELADQGAGYNLHVTPSGTLQVNFVKRWLDDSLRVETTEAIPLGRWTRILMTYDGSRTADGIRVYFNGRHRPLTVQLDALNQTFQSEDPLRIGAGNAHFYGQIDNVRIYSRDLRAGEIFQAGVPASIRQLLTSDDSGVEPSDRDVRNARLSDYYWQVAGPSELRDAYSGMVRTRDEQTSYFKSLPTVMVMQEMDQQRETHILIRGAYDRPGELVEPGVPACLPALPGDAGQSRLDFARWLVSRDNPLTARVTVNRFWRDLFGAGLVRTTEDFGAQGERPTHPELLDWLAVEFVESGWNVKKLLKTIVLSRTYQQSSRTTKSLAARDPDNRLLGRGARFRLPAEIVRDQALFAAGLLTERLGGPSVKPYQPDGLWREIATDTVYEQSHGADLYRRSLYTYWKRTVPAPMMTNFDAAGREACEVRQTRTNTPLQALNLLNDVTFVEAARVLAQNVCESPLFPDDERRLATIFERVLSRTPDSAESRILLHSLKVGRSRFASNRNAATKLLATGEWPVSPSVALEELAAWTLIASTVLNLDEAIAHE